MPFFAVTIRDTLLATSLTTSEMSATAPTASALGQPATEDHGSLIAIIIVIILVAFIIGLQIKTKFWPPQRKPRENDIEANTYEMDTRPGIPTIRIFLAEEGSHSDLESSPNVFPPGTAGGESCDQEENRDPSHKPANMVPFTRSSTNAFDPP